MQRLTRNTFYRMPVAFGPMPGPRQVPEHVATDPALRPRRLAYAASYEATAAQLEALLPPTFALWRDPVVTFEITYLTELEWLAGRGYATFGVRFPAVCNAGPEPVHGNFLSVLWENMADPIISGREELGYSKLFCDISDPRVLNGEHRIDCSWQGFRFFSMQCSNLQETSNAVQPNPLSKGILHHKFMPRTGDWGVADLSYATLTPVLPGEATLDRKLLGDAHVAFAEARWEDLPTLHHIVDAFRALELGACLGADVSWSHGGNSHADQCIIGQVPLD